MSKRSVSEQQWLLSPGLKEAPVLDLMCSHFVLTLAARQGAKFNVRRDLNSLLSLSGRHLVWPLPALQRLLVKALGDKQEVAFSGGATVMKIIGG